MSLDEPEPVDSALTFPSGYDTLEYSWVKATAVSMRLRILFVTLQSTNTRANDWGIVDVEFGNSTNDGALRRQIGSDTCGIATLGA